MGVIFKREKRDYMKKLIYTRKELFGLIFILIVSILFNQILIDNSFYASISNKVKDLIDIIFVITIFVIGIISLDNSLGLWAKKLWQYTFIIFLLIFISFVIIDWYILPFSTKNGQYRFGTIKQLITNPFFFLLLIMLRNLKSITNS